MGGVKNKAQTREVTPEELAAWRETFAEAISIAEAEGIDYLVGGSTACNHWGRPAAIGDIDLIVKPTDAKRLLKAFAAAGYDTDETYPQWLYKAHKRDSPTVDLLFEMEGSVYMDDDMVEHGCITDIHGIKARMVSAEDYVVTQALSTEEDTPDYWHNALSVLSRSEIDYDYLVARAESAGPRRVLSLLIYADSTDTLVPDTAIARLFGSVYGS